MGILSAALLESNKAHWSQLTTASMCFIKDWMSIGKLISAPSLVKFPPVFWSDNLYLIFKEKFTLLSLFWGQFLFWIWIEIIGETVPNSFGMCITKTHLFVEHNKLCNVHRCDSHCAFCEKMKAQLCSPPPSLWKTGLPMQSVLILGKNKYTLIWKLQIIILKGIFLWSM